MQYLSSDHQGESQRIKRMVGEIEHSAPSATSALVLVAAIFAVVLSGPLLKAPTADATPNRQSVVLFGSQVYATPDAQNQQQKVAKAIDQGLDLNKLMEATSWGGWVALTQDKEQSAVTIHEQFSAEIERAQTTELPPTF